MLLEPSAFVAAFAVVVLASAVQGSIGFGANLVAMPIMVQIEPALVPGPTLLATAVLNVLIIWAERDSVQIKPISEALVGRVAGTLLAVVALGFLSPWGLSLLVALVVLAAVAIAAAGYSAQRTRRNMVSAGTVSGFTATTAGIGGPPVALLFQDAPGPAIRGSMGLYFLIGLAMTLTGLAIADRFGAAEIQASLALIPASVIGYGISRPLCRVVDRGYARPAILTLCSVAAIVLLVRLFVG